MRSCGDNSLFIIFLDLKATLIILNVVLHLKYLYFLTEKKKNAEKQGVSEFRVSLFRPRR